MDIHFVVIFFCVCYVSGASVNERALDNSDLLTDLTTMDLKMRDAHPSQPDEYYCTGYKIEKDQYIVKFKGLADAGTAHHILVFGCKEPATHKDKWKCGQVCQGQEQILFAWAKNAPPLQLPKEVGRHVGPGAGIDYIVLQVHYARVFADADKPDQSGIRIYLTQKRQKFVAGIYLLLAYDTIIPANTKKVHADMSCRFDWQTSIFPFGYRTHAHKLGKVISGYRFRNESFEMIGKGNPQWPQAFYPVGKKAEEIEVKPGDVLAARCTYSSIGRNRITRIGSTHNDEMCNFYIMYYMDAAMENARGSDTCPGNNVPLVTANLPADSDTPLPPNPMLEEDAKGHVHHASVEQPSAGGPQTLEPQHVLSHKGIISQVKSSSGGGNIADSDNDNHLLQGNTEYSVSNSKSSFDDDYSSFVGRPNPKLLSYYDYPDYYDIMRQRSRVKKPLYDDLLGSRMNGFNDYADPGMMMSSGHMIEGQSKSRNRNKFFEAANQHYNDHSAEKTLQDSAEDKAESKPDSLNLLNPSHDSDNLNSKGSNSNEPGKSTLKASNEVTTATAKVDEDPVPHPKMNLKFVSSVPRRDSVVFGQVGGVATHENGDVYIFHRGSRVWNSLSFNLENIYQMQDMKVDTDAIVVIDQQDNVKRSFGKNLFYLPHGLTVDKQGNVWVTDVALHQVFRFPKDSDIPDLTIGERFVPGNDPKHFCKPTDVAVLSTGEFFVADGYCNARIMTFDKNGNFLKQWGMTNGAKAADGYPYPGAFNVPHSLTVAEDRGLVCVADRENGRIQCFDLQGDFIRQIHHQSFGAYLYAIEYCPEHGGVLFAVNGPDYSNIDIKVQGFTIEIDTGKLRAVWNIPNKGLTSPHDVTVHSASHTVYVGELSPAKVWKFEMAETSEPSHQLIAATKAPFPGIYTPGGSATPKFSGHHRYRDPTPFIIPTAGFVHFPEEMRKSDSGLNSGESKLSKVGEGSHAETDSSGKESEGSNSQTSEKEKNVVLNAASSMDNKNSEDVDLSNTEVIEDLQSPKKKHGGEKESFAPALIIGLLLVVPVILLVIITIIVRLYQTGHLGECSKQRSKKKIKFNLGNILNSHKGFDRLSTEDDDHDIDVALDDSDQEEFNIAKNSKA